MTISRPKYPYHYLPTQLKGGLFRLGTFLTRQGKGKMACTICGFHNELSLFKTCKLFVPTFTDLQQQQMIIFVPQVRCT